MADEPTDPGRSPENKRLIEREFVRLRVQSVLREAALLAHIPYGEVMLGDFEKWAKDEFVGAKYDLEVGAMRSVWFEEVNVAKEGSTKEESK